MRILTPYVLSCHVVRGKSVLDVGCGLGYGSWLLAANGVERLVAVDLNEAKVCQTVAHCARLQEASILVMDAQRLGFRDASFDAVTCFEVIEHVPRPDMLLSEVERVLRPDGILILSTPNRAVRLLPVQRPWNPEHLREYTLSALRRELERHFSSFTVLGVYGRPALNAFYRRLWRQNPFRVYSSWVLSILRVLTPAPVGVWMRSQRSHGVPTEVFRSDADLLNMAVPAPDPQSWPFYAASETEDCLNFVAICSSDRRVVENVVSQMKRLA